MRHTLAVTIATLTLSGAARADSLQDGIALYREGRFAEAEARLREASGTEASAYLAAAVAKQKRFAEAVAPADAALGADPGHAVAAGALGEALVGQEKYDDAVARLSTVLAKNAGAAYAYYWRGQAFHHKKQVARMVEDYQAFLKLAPEAPEAAAVKVMLASLK
jgi:tetratricopeptide (TPR) repeat protein